ncbi:MAG: glycosyltransferase family 2 protein [Alphaproteobacteria bacterium]
MSRNPGSPAAPRVSFVVVTMNRREDVADCLESIEAQDYDGKEIVVVDNGSADGTPEFIRRRFPDVRLIALSHNTGAAGGRNRGVAEATGEICIFVDDDGCLSQTDATRRVIERFAAEPLLACIAFRIADPVTGRVDVKTIPRTDKLQPMNDFECSYFCGAGFAMRRDAFLACGGFWERLFYGVEELEFSYRLLAHGYTIRYAPDVTVDHKEVPTARPKGQWVYFQVRNRCWISARHMPWRYVLATTFLWWSWCALVAIRRRQVGIYFRAVADALRGLPQVLEERMPLDRATLTKVRALAGRVIY